MTIREVRAEDVPAILAIWNPIIRDTAITFNSAEKSSDELAATIEGKRAEGFPFLVADHDGDILGFGTYGQFRGGVGYARTMEHTIILDAEARGQGIGRRMLEALTDHARDRGVHALFAGVSSENPTARAFHLATGFTEVAILREVGYKFGRYLDLHLLQRML